MLPLLASLIAAVLAAPRAAVALDGGVYVPFYPPSPGQEQVSVATFAMDAAPVTNAEFLAFVIENPGWQRGEVPTLKADSGYLRHWAAPTALGPEARPEQPVTHVSWFAARAYCQAHDGSLPTVHQWEYAADATLTAPQGARTDPEIIATILGWYSQNTSNNLPDVASQPPSYWGLYDMHGLIWEWTEDFSSLLLSADTRSSDDEDQLLFCGAGALSAIDPSDYTSFMRFALRSSLRASFTVPNLGFRCAYTR